MDHVGEQHRHLLVLRRASAVRRGEPQPWQKRAFASGSVPHTEHAVAVIRPPETCVTHIEQPGRLCGGEYGNSVLALGATRVTEAIEDDTYRVYRDPAGHTFCLVWGASSAE